MGICDGRSVIITGAARGLGRAYALAFAAEGANVVVNDIGGSMGGAGEDASVADAVVAELKQFGFLHGRAPSRERLRARSNCQAGIVEQPIE